MKETRDAPALPDRLSVDSGSPHHVAAVFEHDIGAVADCAGPVITNVRAANLTDYNAIIRWQTSEASSSRVEWGTSPGALTNVATDAAQVTDHAVTIGSWDECARIYFRVSSTDALGNESRAGFTSAFSFNAQTIPGLFKDQFESNSGWTLEGEWQIGAPQGKGNKDPNATYAGNGVPGHDLTGRANPGNYEPNTTQKASSPTINASGLSAGRPPGSRIPAARTANPCRQRPG